MPPILGILREHWKMIIVALLFILTWIQIKKSHAEGLDTDNLEAIENLGLIAKQLRETGKVTIPGDLEVEGVIRGDFIQKLKVDWAGNRKKVKNQEFKIGYNHGGDKVMVLFRDSNGILHTQSWGGWEARDAEY